MLLLLSLQLCPTLWDPIDGSPSGSSIPGILQARILEWIAIAFSRICARSLQLCSSLNHPVECSPPGSSLPGILQARILEWVATPSSRGSSQPRDRSRVSHIVNRRFTIWATREVMSEKAMETHSSSLAWKIPGMGEPGGLLSMGLHRVGHDWSDLAAAVENVI